MKTNPSAVWPKIIPPLTPEQKAISDDFMRYWHEVLPKRFGIVDEFNHRYPVKHAPCEFLSTLEVGAGLGTHLQYEQLTAEQERNYVALELRENMAAEIRRRFPAIQAEVGGCQEQLANLPAALRELHRVCHPERGALSVVIPCEGGFAYGLARKISAQRLFEKRYHQSYDWFIRREHINLPTEIFSALAEYFLPVHSAWFPLLLPSVSFNLCIGLTLRPKPVETQTLASEQIQAA